MSRLTKQDREFVHRRVMDFKFADAHKALRAEAEKALHAAAKVALGKHYDNYNALPEDWTRAIHSVAITVDGQKDFYAALTTPIRFPVAFSLTVSKGKRGYVVDLGRWGGVLVMKENALDQEGFLAEMRPVCEKIHDHVLLRCEVSTTVEGVLNSVTTWNKLYELWPELAEIVPPPAAGTQRSTALTVDIKKLNELIPLPTEKTTVKRAAKKAGSV